MSFEENMYPCKKWRERRFYSLDAFCKNTYGEKLYKIALDAGMTCPNRDGHLGTKGCIFCSEGGSGDFAVKTGTLSVREQIEQGRKLFAQKRTGSRFIAYFQAYTNTYAPVEKLREIYSAALEQDMIAGISIATRPDCVPKQVLELLKELKGNYPDKFIWVELGLQTIHEETAVYLRRGYSQSCFLETVKSLNQAAVLVIVHIILGLPGETPEMLFQTISCLNKLKLFGIKLQLLHVLKNTDLAIDYERGCFEVLSKEAYLDLVIRCLERLSPEIVVHRLTGDGPKNLLIAPLWSRQKRDVLNTLFQELKRKDTWQGKFCTDREGD